MFTRFVSESTADRIRLLIVTIWAGSLWTIGYLVAPTLFATLADRSLAGSIAGSLFRVEAWLSLGCGALLLMLHIIRPLYIEARKKNLWLSLILAMLLCTALGHFALQPMMAELKAAAGPGGVLDGATKERFAMLHGISSSIYLFQSLLAALLMFRAGARRNTEA